MLLIHIGVILKDINLEQELIIATPVQVEQKGERSVKATFIFKIIWVFSPDTVQKQLNS